MSDRIRDECGHRQRHTVSTATGYRTKSWEHLVVSVKVTQVQLDSQEEKGRGGGGGEREGGIIIIICRGVGRW